MTLKTKKTLSLSGRFTFYFLAICTVLSLAFSMVFFITGRNQMVETLKGRLMDIVTIGRYAVEETPHESLIDFKNPDKAAYSRIQKTLQRIRDDISDIHYIYTMTGNEKGQIVFVVDADINPLTAAKPGTLYDNPGPVLKREFYSMAGPTVEKRLYTDRWGSWLSGYIPLKGGKYPIILGMDISAKTIDQYNKKLLTRSLLIFLASLPLIIILGYLVGSRLARPVVDMTRTAEEIGNGDFGKRLPVNRRDELGKLTATLNKMAECLQINHDRMESLIAKYKGIFDNALEGIFQSSTDGRLITVNKALASMTGYDSPVDMIENVKRLDEDIYSNREDREEFLNLMRRDKRVDRFRFQVLRKDRSSFWAEMNVHLAEEGIFEGMIMDISESLEAERAEAERLAALASSSAKSEFLANMSHEIRTPLNAVIGLGDLLDRTSLSEKQRQYLKKMKSSSHTLLALINDILDFSKIEAGHLELEKIPFSLYEVIENLTEMFGHRASEKEIELLVDIEKGTPNALIGDPSRLGQILINLTGNALKFTEKGEIVIKAGLEATKPDGSVVLGFSVRDTGAGIEKSRMDNIFDSFTQEDQSVTRKYGGTGLGLTITRQLVEIMDGNISVMSKQGEGSIFSFTACFGAQPLERQLITRPPRDLRGLKVLVVDDNQTARDIITEIILSFEMDITAASSGEEALDLLEDESKAFDLIILDWKMPGLNGIETARRIKENRKLDKLPIVCMVSAYGREDLMHESDRSFLDVFLHKPINPSLLFDSIMEIYGRGGDVIPASSEKNQVKAGQGPAEIPLMKGNILLVEDNAINTEIAKEWLCQAGLTVCCAENGREAIDLIESEPFDLVLMDIQMPVMDGLEATRILRSRPEFNDLPIVAMTAHALKGDREKGMDAGMNDYITKPIDPAGLFKTLSAYLGQADYDDGDKSSKEEASLSFTDLAGVNLEAGLFRANRNSRLYEKLLLNFHEEFKDALETVDSMVTQNKVQELKRYLHTIKGVAANLGAEDLSDRAAEFENASDFSGRENREFASEIKKIMDGLGKLYSEKENNIITESEPQPSSEVLDTASFICILEEVGQEIFDDLNMVNSRILEHASSFSHHLGNESFDLLKSHLSDFALEEAESQIHKSIESLKKS